MGETMERDAFEKWQDRWGEKKALLESVGIKPFGYDPGIISTIDGVTVDLPTVAVDLVCDLIKQRADLLDALQRLQQRTCHNCPDPTDETCCGCYFVEQVAQAKTAIEKAESL